MISTCFESQECIRQLVCIAGECQCCEQRAHVHQYIFHHWLTLKIKNHKKSKWIFWITRQPFPITLVQGPHSDPLWKKHCMSIKKISAVFNIRSQQQYLQYPGNPSTQGVVFLYVVIFQQMTYFLQLRSHQIW
jgi:hypothetical protein